VRILSNIAFVAFILVTITGCEKYEIIPESLKSPYDATEQIIRKEYDGFAVFRWSDYYILMDKLSGEKFTVLPINEMRQHYDPSKVVVGLRHDMDFNAFKGLEMADIEKSYGIRSTYYILATSKYYGQLSNTGIIRNIGMDSLYKRISNRGAEIGIHNDLLTVMITYGLNPFLFNSDELEFYNSIGIEIHGTASHGSPIARLTVPNYQIFSDFAINDSVEYNGKKYPLGIKTLTDFGFEYETYFIDFNIYLSDSGGKWNDPENFAGILKRLDNSVPGDRIQILVHPDWWGSTW
jgi:hypothetical protein